MGLINWLFRRSNKHIKNFSSHDILCIRKSMETLNYSDHEIDSAIDLMQRELMKCPRCPFALEKYYSYGNRNGVSNIRAIIAERKKELQLHILLNHGQHLP